MRRLEPGIREELLGNPAQKHSTGAWYATAQPQRVGRNPIEPGVRRRSTSVHNVPGMGAKRKRVRRR